MTALRRVLYLQAGVWALAGIGLGAAPRFFLVTVFDQPPLADFAWARLLGIQLVVMAMLMVLVSHRAEDLWWWSWAFALGSVATAAVVVLNLAFSLSPRQSRLLWWIFAVVSVGFALGTLYGLYVSSRERPFPEDTG